MTFQPPARSALSRYGMALLLTVVVVALRFGLQPVLGGILRLQLLTFAVLLSAWWGGLGPGVVATALCATAGQYFFFAPFGSLHITNTQDAVRVLSFIALGVTISIIAEALHRAVRGEQGQKEALRVSEERLRLAVKATEDAVWDWDIARNTVGWSPAVAQRFGWPEAQPGTGPAWWQERIHPDDRARVVESMRAAIADPATSHWEAEYRFRRGDGTQAEVLDRGSVLRDSTGRAVRMIGAMLDLTTRKQAEIAVRESREALSLALTGAKMGTWDWDIASGALQWSDRTFELFGLARRAAPTYAEFIGSVHPEDRVRVEAEVRKALENEPHQFECEYRALLPDGSQRWLFGKGAAHLDAAGQPARLLGMLMDVTDRVLASERLAAALDAAEAANRAKDTFLAALSHELRTPLTPVLFLAATLERSLEVAPALREDFAMIRRNIELEARLIDDLLDLTRITRGKLQLDLEPTDLHAILARSIELLRQEIDARKLDFEIELTATRHQASADPVRLQQVFWNLLKNAVKFTPEGGTVSVRSRAADSGAWHLTIADSGLGITAEELPRIFDAFAQGEEAASHRFGGLGLGLAISHLLVREHRGRIWAESAGRNCGAIFHVEIPLDATPAATSTATRSDAPATAPRAHRLLVVEDHEPTWQTLSRLLKNRGYEVTIAATAEHARTLAASSPFDFMISDLGLPDGSGHDLAAEFNRAYGLRAIALSGYGMEEDLQRSKNAGFLAHITKPVDIDALHDAILRALDPV